MKARANARRRFIADNLLCGNSTESDGIVGGWRGKREQHGVSEQLNE